MTRPFILSGLIALTLTSAAMARSPQDSAAAAGGGELSAEQVGVQPRLGVSTHDYIREAAASDLYEVEAGELAQNKSHRDEVKGFGHAMVEDHQRLAAQLMSALDHEQPPRAHPPEDVSPEQRAMLDQLKAAPDGAAFDLLYIDQQRQAHRRAWALQQGYATDGEDPTLRALAGAAVPVIDHHLEMIRVLQTAR